MRYQQSSLNHIQSLAAACLLLFCQGASAAAEPHSFALARAAVERLDAVNLDDDWYFSMTMTLPREQEVLLIHSDPRRTGYDRRQLVSVNGEEPDPARLKKFRDDEIKRIDEQDRSAERYGRMVDVASLQLLEEDEQYARFAFTPRLKRFEDAGEKLRGTLRLNLLTAEIEEIEILNTASLSPAFSVSLDNYRLQLIFGLGQGVNLLQEMQSHFAGKAGFFKKFDAQLRIDFADHRRFHASPSDNTAALPNAY